MFVRWRRKQRKDRHTGKYEPVSRSYNRPVYAPDYLRSASLVESVRVDGKPRQRTIGYLASIREWYLDPGNPHHNSHCSYFWRKADASIAALALSDEERVRIEAALEDVVPRPDLDRQRADLEAAKLKMQYLAAELGHKLPE